MITSYSPKLSFHPPLVYPQSCAAAPGGYLCCSKSSLGEYPGSKRTLAPLSRTKKAWPSRRLDFALMLLVRTTRCCPRRNPGRCDLMWSGAVARDVGVLSRSYWLVKKEQEQKDTPSSTHPLSCSPCNTARVSRTILAFSEIQFAGRSH